MMGGVATGNRQERWGVGERKKIDTRRKYEVDVGSPLNQVGKRTTGV